MADPPIDENLFFAIKQELNDLETNPANEYIVLARVPELPKSTEPKSHCITEKVHGYPTAAVATCSGNLSEFANVRNDKPRTQDVSFTCTAKRYQSQSQCSDGDTFTDGFDSCVATGDEVDKNRTVDSVSHNASRSCAGVVNVEQAEKDKMLHNETERISKSGRGKLSSNTVFTNSSPKNVNTDSLYPSTSDQQNDSKSSASKLPEKTGQKSTGNDTTNLQTNVKPIICRVCEKKFTKSIALDAHYKAVHNLNNPYQCWRCVYCTSTYSCMERHMEFCGSPTPFPCEHCMEMLENMGVLSEHCVKLHSESAGRIRCTECAMVFDSDPALTAHSEEFHRSENSPELFCSECDGDVFENTTDLLEHKVCTHSKDFTIQIPKVKFGGKRKRVRNKVLVSSPGEEANIMLKQETVGVEVSVDIDRPKRRKLPKVRLMASKNKKDGKKNRWIVSKAKKDPNVAQDANLDTDPNFAPEAALGNESDNETLAGIDKSRKVAKKAPKVKKVKTRPGKPKPKKAKVNTDNCDTLYLCPHADSGCKYKSTNKYNLGYHMRTHQNRYSCESCDFQCRKKGQLKSHYQSAHDRDIHPGFLCSMCGKNFRTGTKLKIHIRVHNNDRPFICDQCGQGFASKYMMSEHQKVKHGGENFPCEICGKQFPVKKYLSKHVKTHDATKPFLCDVCPKGFKTANHLKAHKRVHTGEKPFECKECGKSFKQICGLMAHKNIHKGEKTFNCTMCRRAFMYNTSLRSGLCLHCRKSGHENETETLKTRDKGDFTDLVKSRSSGYFPSHVPAPGIPGITTGTVARNFVNFAKTGAGGVLPAMQAGINSENQ